MKNIQTCVVANMCQEHWSPLKTFCSYIFCLNVTGKRERVCGKNLTFPSPWFCTYPNWPYFDIDFKKMIIQTPNILYTFSLLWIKNYILHRYMLLDFIYVYLSQSNCTLLKVVFIWTRYWLIISQYNVNNNNLKYWIWDVFTIY